MNQPVYFLPLVELENTPKGSIANSIVRIVGEDLHTSDRLLEKFNTADSLSNLISPLESKSIVITAGSQDTGEDQHIFMLYRDAEIILVDQIATVFGNYVDIDMWSIINFDLQTAGTLV